MLEIMDSLSRQAAQRTRELMEERASGTPLVVYGGRFIPSELICAAGANVFPLLGSGEPVFETALKIYRALSGEAS